MNVSCLLLVQYTGRVLEEHFLTLDDLVLSPFLIMSDCEEWI